MSVQSISRDFGVSTEASGLVITLFLLGYCAGPLFFAPLSEFFGRRWIFYITFTTGIAFNFLCAFAPNFAGLLVGRFITGTCASASLSNTPGVLADLWGPVGRGNFMAIFSMFTFVGPALAPVVGGFIELKLDWRWMFYVFLWMGGLTEIFLLTIPETLPAIVLQNKAKRIRKAKIPGYENVIAPVEATNRTLGGIFKIALTRPWIILFDTISFLVAIYLSVVYTLLYMLFTIYPIVFQEKRGWNSGVGELPLVGSVVGAAIGAAVVFWFSYRDRKKYENGYKGTPEDRLIVGMIGGVGFCVTMFWFAWTANFNSIHWIVPTLAGVFLSASILLVFVAFLNYLTDSYLMYAASAMAANTIARSACGAAAPLFTNQMFEALGVGGGGSLIGGVAALLAIIPFAFYKYGKGIRERSKFAPTAPPAQKEQESEEKQVHKDDEAEAVLSSDSSSTQSTQTSVSLVDREAGHLHETKDAGSMHEVTQNAFGQPRTENTRFGKEDV